MVGGASGENADEDPQQPGDWDKDGSKDIFVIDFKLCVKNHFAVMLCQDKDTLKQFIEVAKIITVDKDNKTFQGRKLQCTKDATSAQCLQKNAAWNEHGKNTETCEGSCVIVYLKKLNKGGKLSVAAINAITERGVFEEFADGEEVGGGQPNDDNDNDDDDDDDDDDEN